ncbi:MAG: tetratricopeptide repeat protein, partial [Planctomycetaceae bacterium]|nr:tetratricopeptide repeat protein [Planctomycetaceae bacterium]
SHFVNAFVLDKDGNRIDRRNAQDIVVPLYNHQIPPGAGQTVHYRLSLPDDLSAPITVDIKLQYRKFDGTYMEFVARTRRPGDVPLRGYVPGKPYVNNLPITTLAHDRITFPVAGVSTEVTNSTPKVEAWMRWNDYGIGLFLKGKKELRQAADAFAKVEELDRYDGPLNLARVLEREGSLDLAVDAIRRAAAFKEPAAPPWTIAWLSGVINRQQNRLEEAQGNFEKVLTDQTADMRRRRFDFSLDYRVRNLLGETLYDRSRGFRTDSNRPQRVELLQQAVATFEKTLEIDSENATAHANLAQIYKELGDTEKEVRHREFHDRYRPDDTAQGRAARLARQQYPAANDAADEPVIYFLNRDKDERASQNK